jgi:hypothetical protein
MEEPRWDFFLISAQFVELVMKTTKHIIEINAREAFLKIGLRLDESPIGAERDSP